MSTAWTGPPQQISFTDESPYESEPTWTDIPLDHVMEEGSEMPSEEEATVAGVRGEATAGGVRTTWALAIAGQGEAYLDEIQGGLRGSRVWLRLRSASGADIIVGGPRGCRHRLSAALDMQYGGRAVRLWMGDAAAPIQVDEPEADLTPAPITNLRLREVAA